MYLTRHRSPSALTARRPADCRAPRAVAATALLAAALWLGPLGTLAVASPDNAPASDANPLLPVTASPTAVTGDSEIKARLAVPGAASIAGEPLHAALLRRFYDGHGNQPIWATHTAQATALWHAVLNAANQ